MVTRQAKRVAVESLIDTYAISQRRACRVVDFPLTTYRYRSFFCDDPILLQKMKSLADSKPRYGMPRIHELLRRDGIFINHKKVERLYYQVLKLGLRRKKPRRKYRSAIRSPIAEVTSTNQIWSMDFVSDQLASGRRVRGFAVIDVFNRKNLVLDFDTSLTGQRVVYNLERLYDAVGAPEVITVDNGPEFICLAVDQWACSRGVKLQFSRPGKPTDNPFIESFNGKMRDEFLNTNWFTDLADLRSKAAIWQKEYNELRPHSSLGMLSPEEYTVKNKKENYKNLIE